MSASARDVIVKDHKGWVFNGLRFSSLYSGDTKDALRFKDLDSAKHFASHLRKIAPATGARAIRALYSEQKAFDAGYKSIGKRPQK